MNPKSGNHRVLLVFLLFLPASFIAMWFIGGSEQKIELVVSSSLSPAELQDRFNRIVAKLESLSPEQIANHALRIHDGSGSRQDWGNGRIESGTRLETRPVRFNVASPRVPSASLCGNVQLQFPLWPLCDIVFPQEGDAELSLDIDPTIIYRDPDFAEATVARQWLGKDQSSVYLQETDGEKHLRLVRLECDKLQFHPTLVDGATGTRVVYEISICHKGFKRIYGKFLERECETVARNRLEWICGQLESEGE